jgi:hypothetical protein
MYLSSSHGFAPPPSLSLLLIWWWIIAYVRLSVMHRAVTALLSVREPAVRIVMCAFWATLCASRAISIPFVLLKMVPQSCY